MQTKQSRNTDISWLIHFYKELENPYFLTDDTFEEIGGLLRSNSKAEKWTKQQVKRLQEAVEFVGDDIPSAFYITENIYQDLTEEERGYEQIAKRRIDLILKKFRNLVASCIGYTYDAVNDRYVNVEKVEKSWKFVAKMEWTSTRICRIFSLMKKNENLLRDICLRTSWMPHTSTSLVKHRRLKNC